MRLVPLLKPCYSLCLKAWCIQPNSVSATKLWEGRLQLAVACMTTNKFHYYLYDGTYYGIEFLLFMPPVLCILA